MRPRKGRPFGLHLKWRQPALQALEMGTTMPCGLCLGQRHFGQQRSDPKVHDAL